MHDFLVTIFIGLGVFTVANVVEDFIPALSRFHGLVTITLAIGAAEWLDYSMFRGLGTELRDPRMGVLVTGLALAGTTSVWRGLLHWMGTSDGEEPEVRHAHRPRLAA